MTPLPFWQLLVALIALLIAGRIVAWWLWRALAVSGSRVGRGLSRLAPGQRLATRFGRRWPRSYCFLSNRLTPTHFSGLPLTLITVLALYLLFLCAGLVEDLFEGKQLKQFDQHVNAALSILREHYFLHVMNGFTTLANPGALVAITFVSIGFLWAYGRPFYIPGLMLAVAGSQTLAYIGKYAINRSRPDFLTFASASTPSFPSGHATGAIAVYGFIIYAIARDLPGARARFELAYSGCALIALIAVSRMILSVHYASDVAAGLLVGAFWLLAGFTLTEYLRERAARARNI